METTENENKMVATCDDETTLKDMWIEFFKSIPTPLGVIILTMLGFMGYSYYDLKSGHSYERNSYYEDKADFETYCNKDTGYLHTRVLVNGREVNDFVKRSDGGFFHRDFYLECKK